LETHLHGQFSGNRSILVKSIERRVIWLTSEKVLKNFYALQVAQQLDGEKATALFGTALDQSQISQLIVKSYRAIPPLGF
jgi:hypothetical protein